MEMCHEIPWQPFQSRLIFFLSLTLLFCPVLTQMRWAASYTYGFIYQLILYMIFFFFNYFSRIYFPTKNHVRYHVIYVTKKIPWKFRGVSKVFLADHVRLCCMRTEQYHQRSFVIHSTILETTTTGKVNKNIITSMTSVVNANLTLVLGENAS